MQITPIAATDAVAINPTVRFNPTDLAAALAIIARRVIERRNTIPVLACVLIQPSADGASITGTDLDIEATATIPAHWEAPGAIVIDAQMLLDCVKPMKGECVTLELADDAILIVDDGQAVRRLRAYVSQRPVDDFPLPFTLDNPLSWQMPAAALSADLAAVAPAMSTEETRYYLNGANVDCSDGKLRFAATDGHRLHVVDRERDAPAFGSHIWPRKLVDLLQRLPIPYDGATAQIHMSGSKVSIAIGRFRIVSKLVDGTFPNFDRQVIAPTVESARAGVLTIAGQDLRSACDAISKGKAKRWTSTYITLEIASDASRYGIARADGFAAPLSGEYMGDDFSVTAVPSYLREAGGDAPTVTIAPGADGGPILIKRSDDEGFAAYLMPARWDGALPAPAPLAFTNERTAPGQAASLWDVHPSMSIDNGKSPWSTGHGRTMATKARAATNAECEAYMRDIAARWGLSISAFPNLQCDLAWRDGICIGATFGGTKAQNGSAVYLDGAFSVAMPGANDKLRETVLLSVQADDGSWSNYARCQDAKGNIALPDAKRERKSRKGKAAAPLAAAAPVEPIGATDAHAVDAIAPVEPVAALAEPATPTGAIDHAAPADPLLERIARLEVLLASAATAPAPVEPDNSDDIGPAALALAAGSIAPPIGVNARSDRARRERIVRAYLRMREARAIAAAKDRARVSHIKYVEGLLLSAEASADKSAMTAHRTKAKRRRAVVKAREYQILAREMTKLRLIQRDRMNDAYDKANGLEIDLCNAERRATISHEDNLRLSDILRQRDATIADMRARPTTFDNKIKPDDLDRALHERDTARADVAKAKATLAAMTPAIERLEQGLEAQMTRALAAETALRAIERRLAGASPIASPAVDWQQAA